MSRCPRCDGTGQVRMKRAVVTTEFYGPNAVVHNLRVPCPECRPECHAKEPPCPKP